MRRDKGINDSLAMTYDGWVDDRYRYRYIHTYIGR